jgi:hypothetical protein
VFFLLATLAGAADKPGSKADALDLFKQLSGEWVGKEVGGPNAGKECRSIYKVTSGGIAVVETLAAGTEHEMVNMIHPDGDNLILTHYCALGNQPQMKAPGKVEGNKVAFQFVHATNLKSDKDPHMHDVAFTFVDKDTLRTDWTFFKDGKASGTVAFEMKRKK